MKKEPECVTLAGRGHAVVLTHHRGHKAGTSFKSVTANVLFIYFSFHRTGFMVFAEPVQPT